MRMEEDIKKSSLKSLKNKKHFVGIRLIGEIRQNI